MGSPKERGGHRKNALRETASQLGSPVIRRIDIHDLCTGLEVKVSKGLHIVKCCKEGLDSLEEILAIETLSILLTCLSTVSVVS